ncbi:hypothetical protein BWI17_16745 [Betaproteobacteria bacterium GR16-43]|nr:hypothetical protein BWI17_16745 [Betaproteobacteria bacterium GR16-43]
MVSVVFVVQPIHADSGHGAKPVERTYTTYPSAPKTQSVADADKKSFGCMSCHTATDRHTMHQNPGVILGCADCHGGDPTVKYEGEAKPAGSEKHAAANGNGASEKHGDDKHGEAAKHGEAHGSARSYDKPFQEAMDKAHVLPRYTVVWGTSANPEISYAKLNKEAPEFVRFMNPGDLRIAREACGACHLPIIQASERSIMATSAMLWGGASYNNGILPFKRYILGEVYTREGNAASIVNPVKPDEFMVGKGILPSVTALPAWETIPPADIFRVFERGGKVILSTFPEVGIPNSAGAVQRLDEPGRPDIKQSIRGPGTGQRIAVPVINITKTRLNDPHLWFLGTNEQPGDYRQSGCTACHTVYANDRDPQHSGVYAKYGHEGKTGTVDPTIPKNESGHPIKHEFTRAIPSSQCMICHMHQPNVFVNSYYGTIMWDYESDAPFMWPEKQKYPTAEEMRKILDRNPEEAAIRGKWGDPEFLKDVSKLNPQLKDTQFADYHGHGWNFRAVFKRDRKGNLLDKKGKIVPDDDPNKWDKEKGAVHLKSIHLDLGFHCVDCHWAQDMHGNGHIQGEVAAAVEIDCADCHGTADKYPALRTSGPAARPGGLDMSLLRTQDGRKRFEWREGKLFQRSAIYPELEWEMKLVKDTVTRGNPNYNEKAARAKLMHSGDSGKRGEWGPGGKPEDYAHGNDKMTCFTCHLSWTTSCGGCHLPIQANWKTERNHYEGGETRNYATYNPQVARDEMFQLGKHGPVKGARIAPIRSSSALVLSSTNSNRERIYIQQPPVAASGFSSQAFAPHYPHTERTEETKTCTDCHVSQKNDNNAIMAQLLLQGTNYVNFVGFNAWLGEEKHVEAVQVTEWEEPQAVIGSYLHKYAYPDWFAAHEKRDRRLPDAHDHRTAGSANCVAIRGEYLFASEGTGGMRVYDVAGIANKGVSQRIISAPFSPLGHDTHVPSKNASCVAIPTNQPINPLRNQGDLMRVTNLEQPFHPIYNYAFITDAEEGLIVVDVNTLMDGEPRNNFFKRGVTWNEGGVLNGARHIVMGGHYAYITTPTGVVIVDVDDPLKPKVASQVQMPDARHSALQFRYLFVTAGDGLRVIDVTVPEKAQRVESAFVPLANARGIYVARSYAYVAAGAEGLAIVDVERPEQPALLTKFTAGGKLDDARDVIVGTTNASAFAYVADGKNGLKVVQLTSPDIQPKFYGFAPEPKPHLIAWRMTASPALAVAKGLDRDRAVDETGGQIAIFGRIGARPFTRDEQQRFYLNKDGTVWSVSDTGKSADYVNLGPRKMEAK